MDDHWLRSLRNHALNQPVFVRVLRDGPNHLLVVTSSDDMNINPFGVRRSRESTNRRSPTEDLPATRSLTGANHDLGDLLALCEVNEGSHHFVGVKLVPSRAEVNRELSKLLDRRAIDGVRNSRTVHVNHVEIGFDARRHP